MTCKHCHGFGYRHGEHLATPQLIPCVCRGGPVLPWLADRVRIRETTTIRRQVEVEDATSKKSAG